MQDYHGIVIAKSLQDPAALDPVVIARKLVGTWPFLLVRVPADALPGHIAALQANMVQDDT